MTEKENFENQIKTALERMGLVVEKVNLQYQAINYEKLDHPTKVYADITFWINGSIKEVPEFERANF